MELLKEIAMSILFVLAVSIVGIELQGCSFKIEAGYHGRSGVSDTTISPEFVESATPATLKKRY